jgi:hypothetical protein
MAATAAVASETDVAENAAAAAAAAADMSRAAYEVLPRPRSGSMPPSLPRRARGRRRRSSGAVHYSH